jgi:hypothetical protein
MRCIQAILVFTIFLTFNNCNDCKDTERQKYINMTFSNNSTSPDYVVFNAIDNNTKLSKEICCESDILYYAFIDDNISNKDSATLMDTYKKAIEKFENILMAKSCDYTFRFNSFKSLKEIGFFDYNEDSLRWHENEKTLLIIDSIMKNYKNDKANLLSDYSQYENIYLIHILIKNGIFCGRDCESGYTVIRNILK